MRRAQVVLAVLVLVTGTGGAASAETGRPAASHELRHCVLTAIEVESNGGDGGDRAAVPPPRCFATFAEAIAEATNGRVQLPPSAQTVTQEQLDGGLWGPNIPVTTAATVIGIEYENRTFGGWSYVIQSTNIRGCAGSSYRISTLPSNRNDAISSARTYANCKSSHYSGTNLTGSRYLCGCSQMGTMNDRTSSLYFSSTGYLVS